MTSSFSAITGITPVLAAYAGAPLHRDRRGFHRGTPGASRRPHSTAIRPRGIGRTHVASNDLFSDAEPTEERVEDLFADLIAFERRQRGRAAPHLERHDL